MVKSVEMSSFAILERTISKDVLSIVFQVFYEINKVSYTFFFFEGIPILIRSKVFPFTALNMPEYCFSLTYFYRYKDRIEDSGLIQENTGQRKSVLYHLLGSA